MRLLILDGVNIMRRLLERPLSAGGVSARDAAVADTLALLAAAVKAHAPTHGAFVLSGCDGSWRSGLCPSYRARLKGVLADIVAARSDLEAGVMRQGWRLAEVPELDSVDVIGCLLRDWRRGAKRGDDAVVLSSDLLAVQFGPEARVGSPFRTEWRDNGWCQTKLGVPMALVPDYLALVGVDSDAIPGVPRIGPKTAAKLLLEYGGLEMLMGSAMQVGGAVGESLRYQGHMAFLSRQLVQPNLSTAYRVARQGLALRAVRS